MSKLLDISKFNLKEDTKSFYSDDLEVEIGDSKDSTMFRNRLKFKPTFEKPNEANFSLGLDHDSCGNDFQKMTCNIEVSENKISFIYDFLRIDLYIVNDLRFEKPSPEYEVTLLSQPKGYTGGEYKLYFSLQTKSLDFYRQPSFKSQSEDLIKEFSKDISISDTQVTNLKGDILAGQPSWNLDSIACYTPFRNNKYKTGKSHHFPRPEMTDKNGFVIINYMEIKNDEMIITIPDGVLQSENYPFRHVTGATLGYTTAGANSSGTGTNRLRGVLGTGTASHQLDSVVFYANKDASDYSFKPVLVEATGKTIVTNGVGPGTLINNVTPQWWTSTYSSKLDISNIDYYVCEVGENNIIYYYDVLLSSAISDNSNSYSSPTDPTDASDTSVRISIFANTSASGGATRRRYTIC